MTVNALVQISLFVIALLALSMPLGAYVARVFEGRPCGLDRVLGPMERLLYRSCGIDPAAEMKWTSYAGAALTFNGLGLLLVYAILRLQHVLPANPENMPAVPADLAFNTAVSFATNTNWQAYGGETTMSFFSQMAGLGVQNFLSAGVGMAVLAALIRGLARRSAATVGNFWFDLTRSVLYVLLPLSCTLAILLVSQGVVQSFGAYEQATLLEPIKDADGEDVSTQTIPLGPAASQIAIKQLGTNGGGFFNVNGAHPLENPTPLSNFFEMLAILLIPAALCFTFGSMVGDPRQGWAIFAAMLLIFVPAMVGVVLAEQAGVPAIAAAGVDPSASDEHSGGYLEGKEVRFGVVNSGIWATATTAASNGSVNAMHDSFTPLGGLVPMLLMQLGEVVFGGVGSGLYGMLAFVIVAVFVAGLMVGRTPEYLGKKIEAFEMKMAALVILIPPVIALCGTAWAVLGPGLSFVDSATGEVKSTLTNSGPHGFSEVLYGFSSAGNNNGSAFGGLNANTPFYNVALGLAMLASRFWLIVPTLALAGSLARKKATPPGPGTLATHSLLFVILIAGTVLLVGALTFVPALVLGPIVEQLQMHQ